MWERRGGGVLRGLEAALAIQGVCSWPESTHARMNVEGGEVQRILKNGFFLGPFHGS